MVYLSPSSSIALLGKTTTSSIVFVRTTAGIFSEDNFRRCVWLGVGIDRLAFRRTVVVAKLLNLVEMFTLGARKGSWSGKCRHDETKDCKKQNGSERTVRSGTEVNKR
jgi:hypothetical protein